MTPGIDDLRVRQNEMDEAEMREVVRHLVYEERARRLARDPGAADVSLAEDLPLVGGQGWNQRQVVVIGVVALSIGDAAGDIRDDRQFHRAFD